MYELPRGCDTNLGDVIIMYDGQLENRINRLIETYENEYIGDDIHDIPSILTELLGEAAPRSNVNISDVNITINNNHPVEDEVVESKRINPMKKRQWSQYVRERGNYTCAKCGKLDEAHCQAHHIFPISKYPDLAYDKGNGIVLCQHCHMEYHKEYQGRESPYTLMYYLQTIEE